MKQKILFFLLFFSCFYAVKSTGQNYSQNDPRTHNYAYDKIGNLIKDEQEEIEEIGWNHRGQVTMILRHPLSTKPELFFQYDAFGNMISVKEDYSSHASIDGMRSLTTEYVRDPFSGMVIAVYELREFYDREEYALVEQHIYHGTTRIGVRKVNIILSNEEGDVEHDLSKSERVLGEKQYELTSHTGNVVAVVSDKKLPDNEPDVVSVTDYYPFGMGMPGRSFSRETYRYGFQGQESLNGIAGNGNLYTAKFWNYNPRVVHRWNIDPKSHLIPQWSPYAVLGNNPIINIDKQGDIWDVFLDAAFILYDVGEIGYDYFTKGEVDPVSVAALGADVGMLFVPVGTGGGLAVRAAAKLKQATTTTLKVFSVGKKVDNIGGFANKALLNDHFVKHGKEFGDKFKNADEYLKGAQDFFKNESDEIIQYTRKNGDIVRYDTKNNIFGTATKDGIIRTMFKPKEGLDYFKSGIKTDLGEENLNQFTKIITE